VVQANALRTPASANHVLLGPQESAFSVREQTLPISNSGAKRRSTRISYAVPLVVTWNDRQSHTVVEEATTLSINCHGFRYFAKQRPQKNAALTFQITDNKGDNKATPRAYPGRVAWVRKSHRLEGLYLVGVELGIPLNIWDMDEVPEDWAAFSPPKKEDPAAFLADVDRILHTVQTTSYYQLLNVEPNAPRSEVKSHFYQLARRFHPDHHMDHPEWTPRLLALMDGLTAAYRTLSDDKTKKEYDSFLTSESHDVLPDSRKLTQGCLERAQECMAEKNFAGCILWLHRAIESDPNSSSYRAMLGRCLSTIPEYRREAVEQFELAIQLDPSNITAHFHYGELLEQLKAPWRARSHYLRVLELDANHWEARERLNRLGASAPRASSRTSLLDRLTGRR
jgi:tetratricopeptide (TPR) repeat protein